MKIQKLLLFILLILFSYESKAIALATLPSTLSDTCVEINLKSGSKIIAKITKKTEGKVYFKKCDNLADTTSYFVLQEKIDNIKGLSTHSKNITSNKEKIKEENDKAKKSKLNKIWILFTINLIALLLYWIVLSVSGPSLLLGAIFGASAIWGFIEAMTYKGAFEGKAIALTLLGIGGGITALIILFILIVLLIGLASLF